MPTYAYRCTECGHEFDIYQSFTDATLTECPECHGVLRKVLHPVGVVFKGSGFYRNDSRSGSGGGGTSTLPKESGPKESSPKESTPKESPSTTPSTGASSTPSTSTSTTTAKPASS